MSEKWLPKVSCSTDMSPTTTLYSRDSTRFMQTVYRAGGGVPGVVGGWWVGGGAIPVPTQHQSQGPIFSHIPEAGPTHGRMKAILSKLMRFPRYGLEWVPE